MPINLFMGFVAFFINFITALIYYKQKNEQSWIFSSFDSFFSGKLHLGSQLLPGSGAPYFFAGIRTVTVVPPP